MVSRAARSIENSMFVNSAPAGAAKEQNCIILYVEQDSKRITSRGITESEIRHFGLEVGRGSAAPVEMLWVTR